MGETRVSHMGKESPLGLSLKEDILQFVKPAALPSYLCPVYLTNDVMTVKMIYWAELYIIKLRYFSLLAAKCLQISKKCKEMHPVRAPAENLGFSSSQPLYISTKLRSSLTITFLVLLCPCEFSKLFLIVFNKCGTSQNKYILRLLSNLL